VRQRSYVLYKRYRASDYYNSTSFGGEHFSEEYRFSVQPLIVDSLDIIDSGLLQFKDGKDGYCVRGYIAERDLLKAYATTRDSIIVPNGYLPAELDAQYRDYFISSDLSDLEEFLTYCQK
jgi:5-deoxy-D-glucuronate isomerase